MAYISASDVAAIRKELKETFPKFKFGVRKDNSLAVDVTILRGPLSFESAFEGREPGRRYAQVNNYYINDNYSDPAERDFLNKVNEIMHNAPGRAGGKVFYDNSDIMTDYFDTAFYTHLKIGSWDKDYECVLVLK